jgi:thiamine biosynthesis lipoprotein
MPRSSRSSSKPLAKPQLVPRRYDFEAIGTAWSIELYHPLGATEFEWLCRLVDARIEGFDQAYSRFRDDSLVTAMSQRPGRYELPPDAEPMLTLYRQLYELTEGRVTPLVGQLLAEAGYDTNYSLRVRELSAVPSWEEALHYENFWLELKRPVLLDLGALGKGYLVDLVGELLEREGVMDYCVDAGGDLRYRRGGGPVLPVGLEHPDNPAQVIGVAKLAGGSLCGSAGNRRAWDRFHHIIDPRLQESPRHIKAAWAVADTTLLADAMTTALFFAQAKKLTKHYNFEYAIINADNSLAYSPGFPAEFF